MGEFLDKNLIFCKLDVENRDEALKVMSNRLLKERCVKETYPSRILEREKDYPTGLETGKINVAIPHTDFEHVIKKSICVATLKNPVKFNKMDDPDDEIEVKIIMMLAIEHPDDHIEFLKTIFMVVQDQDILEKIYNAKTETEILNIMETIF